MTPRAGAFMHTYLA